MKTENFRDYINKRLGEEVVSELEKEVLAASDQAFNQAVETVMEEHKETLAKLDDNGYDQPMIMTEEEKQADLAKIKAEADRNRLVAEEYRKYVGELKRKLKCNSKNQLVEMIANQAWQFNHLQNMARQIHEKNIELEKAIKPEGESNV